MQPARLILKGLAVIHGLVVGCLLGESAAETIEIRPTTDLVRMDGRLDEPVWQEAQALSLTQQSPWPDRPTPYLTEVRVVISGDNLYFGFDCLDPQPEAIKVHTLNALRGRLQVTITATNNFGRLREGRFVQRLRQAQLAFALNPQLVLSSFVQYDNQSRSLGVNTRLRWTLRPGDDLFIVWNRGWQRVISFGDEPTLVPHDESIAVKLRWTVRR